ncbi:hypothetical protein [Bradyrhizobium sp. USDA 4454]
MKSFIPRLRSAVLASIVLNVLISLQAPADTVFVQSTSVFGSMNAKLRLQFSTSPAQKENLRNILRQFAQDEGFDLEDIGAQMPPKSGRRVFWMKLSKMSNEIEVLNIRREELMFIWVYELKSNVGLEVDVSKLKEVLRKEWPDLAPYEGQ